MGVIRSAFGAKCAHKEQDQGHHHDEAKGPTADGWSTEVEASTTTEDEEEENNNE